MCDKKQGGTAIEIKEVGWCWVAEAACSQGTRCIGDAGVIWYRGLPKKWLLQRCDAVGIAEIVGIGDVKSSCSQDTICCGIAEAMWCMDCQSKGCNKEAMPQRSRR